METCTRETCLHRDPLRRRLWKKNKARINIVPASASIYVSKFRNCSQSRRLQHKETDEDRNSENESTRRRSTKLSNKVHE